MPRVAFYITGHGFGHATRMAAVASALAEQVPGLRLSLITTVPEWLLRLNLSCEFQLRPRALDVGVIQFDSIRLDQAATLAAYARLLHELPATLREEAEILRRDGVDLVVADIPPAAFLVAQRAGLPGVGISNFSWDWIYAEYVRALPEHSPILDAIREAYGRADLFLRLPFHGPCDAFKSIRDIPMIARRTRHSREEVRRMLGLDGARPVILLSFGGFEIRGIDFDRVETLGDYCFLATQPTPRPLRNVRVVSLDGLGYEDLVAQADAVITKPGYGIVSECLANRTPVLYTSRGEFAEYAPLVAGLERFGVSAFIGTQDLLAGNWRPSLDDLLRRLRVWPDLPANGAEVAAGILRDYMPRGSSRPAA
ncbi:MAG: glycosyl transferase [candidate division NC10 bacterium]|nr:glycosyl transferase [candidate division NC10 bacterium]